MSEQVFITAFIGIAMVGVLIYGVIYLKAVRVLHEAQRDYYHYLQNYRHYNLYELYGEERGV